MIDRTARNSLLTHIDAFLAGKIKSFDFDERIQKLYAARTDPTVLSTVHLLWYLYDDMIDHPVKFNKEQWDYVQRLRLLLSSDAEMTDTRRWTIAQPIALAALIALAAACYHFGPNWPLFLINTALGIIATLCIYFPRRLHKNNLRLVPFQSFTILRTVRRATPAFHKIPYPRTIDTRPLRRQIHTRLLTSFWFCLLPLIAPIILLAMLRRRREPPTVKLTP